jgi:hypothetical protein
MSASTEAPRSRISRFRRERLRLVGEREDACVPVVLLVIHPRFAERAELVIDVELGDRERDSARARIEVEEAVHDRGRRAAVMDLDHRKRERVADVGAHDLGERRIVGAEIFQVVAHRLAADVAGLDLLARRAHPRPGIGDDLRVERHLFDGVEVDLEHELVVDRGIVRVVLALAEEIAVIAFLQVGVGVVQYETVGRHARRDAVVALHLELAAGEDAVFFRERLEPRRFGIELGGVVVRGARVRRDAQRDRDERGEPHAKFHARAGLPPSERITASARATRASRRAAAIGIDQIAMFL